MTNLKMLYIMGIVTGVNNVQNVNVLVLVFFKLKIISFLL